MEMSTRTATSSLPAVTVDTKSHEALGEMNRASTDALPVLSLDGSECVGVVLRGGIERGCVAMKHDPDSCTVVSHLKRDVTFVAEGVSSVGSRKRPVVFLDSEGLPVDVSLGD